MTKSNGIKSLKQAAKLLNKHAPDGESLAYINPTEARLLKASGGSGIMTLSGVPSYDHKWWHNIYEDYIQPAAEWLGYSGDQGGGRLLKDVTSLGGAYVGYKEAQELSDFEKKQYEEAKAKEIMNQLKFAQESGQGKQLLTPQNVPTDVSRFTEVDIPTMTTTAAQGGRIGYNMGGIDTPFQGIGALNPRMGYQGGMTVEEMGVDYSNPNEMITSKEAWLGDKQGMEEVMITEDIKERFRNIKMARPDISDEQALRKAMKGSGTSWYDLFAGSSDLSEDIDPRMINEMMRRDSDVRGFTHESLPIGAAYGGRIGYNLGGIGALNPRMGYALGEEVEQVTEEVTPFAKIPSNIKMADIDDLPDWWLTDFEQLLEEFRGDNNGRNPQNLNDLEKWHRFKYGKAQGPNVDQMQDIEGQEAGLLSNMFKIHGRDQTMSMWNDFKSMKMEGSLPPGIITFEDFINAHGDIFGGAKGGRVPAQKGGIMPLLDMGGMEKDYRQDGGFVPIGRKEKADDVPARLSKNEFVFTADAVRAAGGGDIDQGAQRMYNVMKNLEAGGEISEQSQGQA